MKDSSQNNSFDMPISCTTFDHVKNGEYDESIHEKKKGVEMIMPQINRIKK